MSLPQGKTPVWNQIKTHILCSTLLRVLLHLAPRFDPLCSALWSYRSAFWSTPLHLCSTTLSFSPQPEINGHQVLQSEGTTHKLRPRLSSFRHAPTLLRHAPTSPSRSDAPTLLCHAPSRSDAPAFYSAPHSSPKLRHFWQRFEDDCSRRGTRSTSY